MATLGNVAQMNRTPALTGGNIIPKGYQRGQLQQFTPEQQQLFSRLFSHVSPESFTGRLAAGDQGAFEQYEAPALRQFQQALGGAGARYSGLGMGAQQSSGFKHQIGGMGTDLAERLAGNRMNLQRSAIEQLMSMSQMLLGQRPYESFLIEDERKNPWGGALSGAVSGATAGAPFGPWGAAIGGLVGGTAGYFGGR